MDQFLIIPKMSKNKTFLIDIGNSSTCFVDHSQALYKGEYIPTARLDEQFVKECFEHHHCVVSSVVPEKDAYFSQCKSVHFVTHDSLPLIQTQVDKPEQVGADRLVNAVAAYRYYGGPCVILDSGTAFTACLIDEKGVYQGGFIFPGMRLCSKALNDYTAKLPLISVSPVDALLGKNTDDAVRVGLYQGFISMIRGTIQSFRDQYPGIQVIGTGNGLRILKEQLDLDAYDELLIFKGLQLIHELQQGAQS